MRVVQIIQAYVRFVIVLLGNWSFIFHGWYDTLYPIDECQQGQYTSYISYPRERKMCVDSAAYVSAAGDAEIGQTGKYRCGYGCGIEWRTIDGFGLKGYIRSCESHTP